VRRATVDGFLANLAEATVEDVVAVLEVKTRGTGARPDRARWHDQVQWQMHVTGVDRAVIAEATIDDETDTCRGVRIHDVTADPDRQAMLASIAEDLWAHCTSGTLPDPDSPSALPVVKDVHASADDSDPVDLGDLADVVARYAEIKAAVKAVSDERDQLEARIREAVGSSTKGECAGFAVSVSRPSLVLTDEGEAELLAAFPELGRVVLDRDRAKTERKSDYEAARRALGPRRLTVKESQ
jgi:predicted phage-related endonuclease